MAELQRLLAARGLEFFLITHPANIFYLCGFSGDAGALLVSPYHATLLTDGRFTIQARQEVRGARIQIVRGSLFAAAGARIQSRRKIRVAYEPARLTVAQHRLLAGAGGRGVRWTGWPGAVENLRMVKSPQEIESMRAAADLASHVVDEVVRLVKPGVRESELAAEIEYRMRSKGASGPAFETIVASGPRAALPHARPSDKPLKKNELVVFDLGAILGGYCSDITRTVFLGRASARIRRWYAAVREAQEAARETLRPGVTAGDVDAAARRVLKRYGLERYFVHSTGHGLGLEVHEAPRLGRGEKIRLEPGNVVTLEPGIYVEGIGGIRIEDDAALTARGADVLTRATREFLEL